MENGDTAKSCQPGMIVHTKTQCGTAVPADKKILPCFDGARCNDEVAFRTTRGYILYAVVQPSEKNDDAWKVSQSNSLNF